MSCLRTLSGQVAGAGAGAVSWVRTWWRQGAWVPGAGAGAVSWLRTWWIQGAGAELACRCSVLVPASDSEVITTAVMGRMNLCMQHHTVLSLERSLSISAVRYLHTPGSVLADSCVKGCTVCTHTFVRIMFYVQRQALNRPLFQRVSACYTHNSRAGYCLALGE